MGRIFKRPDAKSYIAEFKDSGGVWRRKSTHTSDRKSAEAALRRFEREANGALGPGGLPANQAPHALGDAVDWLVRNALSLGKSPGTLRMWAQKAGHLVRVLGRERDVNKLTRDELQGYVNARYIEGAALSTVNKEIITLRTALKFATDRVDADGRRLFRGTLTILPKVKVRYAPRSRFLTIEDFAALLAQLPAHRQLWVCVAVFTGARFSEVAKLDWSDIRWSSNPAAVHLRGTKTDASDRRVPLHPELAGWLWPLRRPNGPVVGGWSNVRRDLGDACTAAGVGKVTPNDLRRTFASWMKQAGVDSAVVAKLLGHSSTKMVDLVYGRLDQATLTRAISSLPGGRAISGRNSGVTGERGEQPAEVATTEIPKDVAEDLVLGPGIEPGTRGFSIRTHVDVDARFAKRILGEVSRAGDRRAMVSATAPAKRLMGRRSC